MSNLDHAFRATNVEVCGFSESSDHDEAIVLVKLVVPRAAKVFVRHQPLETARLQVRPASMSSTVRSSALINLQISSTAQPTDWSTTATLKVPSVRPA
ncbi:hypothetical protein Q5H92_25425 [Hymenobacter sp. M29]|uniref:Uncharacterized protein n=1 Tax=Hymenobacter mellowenesis TaxID=3063995 RepID=A0ABT9AIR9_9BACT|nr:hypothetical protein [Hymenobacter sp. M29]MDO7849729.1 hypothetical protein [Hymenobacter sp. M29]